MNRTIELGKQLGYETIDGSWGPGGVFLQREDEGSRLNAFIPNSDRASPYSVIFERVTEFPISELTGEELMRQIREFGSEVEKSYAFGERMQSKGYFGSIMESGTSWEGKPSLTIKWNGTAMLDSTGIQTLLKDLLE